LTGSSDLPIIRAAVLVLTPLMPVLLANPDGSTRYNPAAEPKMLHWWQTATVENQPYLLPNSQVAAKQYRDFATVWHDDLLEDIKYCQQLVEERGMELLVLDQTRPDIGLNVVKVIVPGLRHFWKRLGAGRLYDVPVQLGWRERALREDEVNSIPLWM
ncbi:MAG: YcaO-like family protein, partial [Kamptonema sp. SIO4C4]|nr:YcaO-like family protein [Kamptonema sp. SIO4C4]